MTITVWKAYKFVLRFKMFVWILFLKGIQIGGVCLLDVWEGGVVWVEHTEIECEGG